MPGFHVEYLWFTFLVREYHSSFKIATSKTWDRTTMAPDCCGCSCISKHVDVANRFTIAFCLWRLATVRDEAVQLRSRKICVPKTTALACIVFRTVPRLRQQQFCVRSPLD